MVRGSDERGGRAGGSAFLLSGGAKQREEKNREKKKTFLNFSSVCVLKLLYSLLCVSSCSSNSYTLSYVCPHTPHTPIHSLMCVHILPDTLAHVQDSRTLLYMCATHLRGVDGAVAEERAVAADVVASVVL